MTDPIDNKGTRFDIFCTLVSSRKPMTASAIAKKMKQPRQLIAYHLPALEDTGLIVHDGNDYFCQPIFINEDLMTFAVDKMQEIFAKMIETGIYTGTDEEVPGDDDKEVIATNCLQALIYIVAGELAD